MAVKAIVTDIEGTTSSLSFVKDVLFPYARSHMADYLHQHAAESLVQEQLAQVRALTGLPLNLEESIAQLIRWIDEDKKITPLKTLQGMIWEAGYKAGDFQGHVYNDAVDMLRRWKQQGLRLYVYSSGSIQAQKLLFAHTAFGDLTSLFDGYFDTHIGGKRAASSYAAIAASLGLAAPDILFLSDIKEELDAAREAGMQTMWLVREGMPPSNGHPQSKDFYAILPEQQL